MCRFLSYCCWCEVAFSINHEPNDNSVVSPFADWNIILYYFVVVIQSFVSLCGTVKKRTQNPVDGQDNNRRVTVVVVYLNGNFCILNKKHEKTAVGYGMWLRGEEVGWSTVYTDIYDYIEQKNKKTTCIISLSAIRMLRNIVPASRHGRLLARTEDRKSCAAIVCAQTGRKFLFS